MMIPFLRGLLFVKGDCRTGSYEERKRDFKAANWLAKYW
jgi:hypothetical protein